MLGDPDPRRATTARRGLYTSLDGSPRGPGDDDDDDDERPIGDPDDDEPLRVDGLPSLVGKASALLDIASGSRPH
jgi:hypothetical protein